MTWNELIKTVAERTGLPQSTTRKVMDALVETITEVVARGDSISLKGVGTFDRRFSAGRVVRSIATRRRMWIGGRHVPVFRPSRALRRAASGGDEAPWKNEEYQKAWRLAETLIDDLDLYHKGMAPSNLAKKGEPADVESACADAFGPHWAQVRRTWDEKVGENVKTPFLGIVARRRWG